MVLSYNGIANLLDFVAYTGTVEVFKYRKSAAVYSVASHNGDVGALQRVRELSTFQCCMIAVLSHGAISSSFSSIAYF